MKLVKHIIYSITLALVVCKSLFIIEPVWETFGYARGVKYMILLMLISAFIISDLWLHSFKIRIIGIAVFVSLCLFGVYDYTQSKENDLLLEEMGQGVTLTSGSAVISVSDYEEYWKLNGLLAGYLIAGIGVSHYIVRKR